MPPSLPSTSGMPNKDRSFHESPEKAGGEGWLYSEQQQRLCLFKPDTATDNAQWVAIRTYSYIPPSPPEQQAMFAEMGVKTFYIGVSNDDSGRATVMFQGPENVLYDIFMNPETKPVVEASGHIYDVTVVTLWLA